jgi:hypothetical protein
MHALATLLKVGLGTLIIEAEEMWATESVERRQSNQIVAQLKAHSQQTISAFELRAFFG